MPKYSREGWGELELVCKCVPCDPHVQYVCTIIALLLPLEAASM
jgi:hypothetical protein